MTNPFYGSSLFQARKTEHVHQHSHLHNRKSSITHARSHADFHNRREIVDLDPRDSTVTEVVQTISVVQIIDGAGATLSAQTLAGDSQTDLVDGETGSTIAVNYKAAVTTSAEADTTSSDVETTTTASSDVSAVSTADPVSATDPTISSTESTSLSSTDSLSLSATETTTTDASTTETSTPDGLSLTHISSDSASAFSTLSSSSNSTTSSVTSTSLTSTDSISSLLSTIVASSNSSSTTSTDSASSTSSDTSLSASPPSTFASTTFASSIFSSSYTTGSDEPSSTGWHSPAGSDSAASSTGQGGTTGATTTDAGTSSTGAASGSSNDSTTTTTSKVAGGIVGGIAGVALLVVFAFMILRLKKRGWCHLRLGAGVDEPDAAARQALPAPSGGGGSGGAEATSAYGTMQQRSAPQAMAASLAALAGKRSSRERAGSGPEMAERGFVRVSGKKLPPVLQYGGDGYSDPRPNRGSHMTDASASVYRDSVAVFDQPNHRPLALGSPMRPESGIMTMHAGPARTPVTSRAPSTIDSPTLPRSSTFPATDALGRTLESDGFSRETIGRTLAAHDTTRDGAASRGSHNSRGSTRFTEHVD